MLWARRAIHQARHPPTVLTSIFQLFLFTHYARQLSRIWQTPSRNRDSRRSRPRCGRVAAKWCADERSQTGRWLAKSGDYTLRELAHL